MSLTVPWSDLKVMMTQYRAKRLYKWELAPLRPASIWKGCVGGAVIGLLLAVSIGAISTITESIAYPEYAEYQIGMLTFTSGIGVVIGAVSGLVVLSLALLLQRFLPTQQSLKTLLNATGSATAAFSVVYFAFGDLFENSFLGGSVGAAITAATLAVLTVFWAHLTRTSTNRVQTSV